MRYAIVVCLALLCLLNSSPSYAQFPWSNKKLTADDYLAMVVQKIREKDYRKAINIAYVGLENRPDYMDLHFMQGRAFMLHGQLDSARIKMKHVMTKAPRYRDSYLLGTNIEMQLGNKEEASCIINDGLYYFPYERDFMIKKLEVLDFNKDYRSAEKYAEKLIKVHFNDSIAINYYIGYKLEMARYYTKMGNYFKARECYSAVLEEAPYNKEASEGMFNLEIKKGNIQASIEVVNAELNKNPRSYEFLTKKATLLVEQYRYAEALLVTQQLIGYYPSDVRAQILHYETQMAAGRFYMKEDPYLVFQGILEKRPNDKEAYNYVINLATARGLYLDALAYENRALKTYPNDLELLQKKVGTLETMQRYTEAANTAEKLYRIAPNNNNYRQQVVEFNILSGRQHMKEMEYDSALQDFDQALTIQPNNYDALYFSAEVYANQKKYDEALEKIDLGLNTYPQDEKLMFKRAVVLYDAGQYDYASQQAMALFRRRPDDKRYENLVVDIKTVNAKKMMNADDYDGAREEYRVLLGIQPTNMDALNGMINLESGSKHYDSALYYCDLALIVDPTNRDLLLKKSSVLEAKKEYKQAYEITGGLMQRYPYNGKIKQTHIEQLLSSGRDYNKKQQWDSALIEFNKVLDINPRDSNALGYSINILLEKNLDDSALKVADKALHNYPGNETFTFKRAIILDKMQRYEEASLAADSVALMNPILLNIDFADNVKAKSLKNQLGLMFLYTTFDSANNVTRANIATLQYFRTIKKGSIGGRLNMAGRSIGTGLQLEVDINYNHNKTFYSFGSAGISNDIVFPSYKLGYSLFYNYSKDYTFEAGLRFLRFNLIDISLPSFVLSSTRYWNDFWMNLRYFGMMQGGNLYHAVNLSGRQYLTPDKEYVTAALGFGSSPDEFSRNFQLAENIKIRTYNFSVGYGKIYKYRNTFSITGTWYNQELPSGFYRNQYDLFLMFLRKF
ncbi:MAG: tetratricopeptide repeat protein [Bacteroidota bacterium]